VSREGGLEPGGGAFAIFTEESIATTGISSTVFGEGGVGALCDAPNVSSEGGVQIGGEASTIFDDD
jgi:hypothetical protein